MAQHMDLYWNGYRGYILQSVREYILFFFFLSQIWSKFIKYWSGWWTLAGILRHWLWIKLLIIKANPTRLQTSTSHLGMSIHPDILPVYIPPVHVWSNTSCAAGAANLVCRSENTWPAIWHEQRQHSRKDSKVSPQQSHGAELWNPWRAAGHLPKDISAKEFTVITVRTGDQHSNFPSILQLSKPPSYRLRTAIHILA